MFDTGDGLRIIKSATTTGGGSVVFGKRNGRHASSSSSLVAQQKCPQNDMRAILGFSPRAARQNAYSVFNGEKVRRRGEATISIARIIGSVALHCSRATSKNKQIGTSVYLMCILRA
jgi:hypothetical protein